MAVNTFVQNKENQAWYYLDEHGYAVTGKRIINGKNTALTQKAVKSKVR